jgi:hypothetical protein
VANVYFASVCRSCDILRAPAVVVAFLVTRIVSPAAVGMIRIELRQIGISIERAFGIRTAGLF